MARELVRLPHVFAEDPLELSGSLVDGRYLVERLVGVGGFGLVYRARHVRFDSPIALKILHRNHGSHRELSDFSLDRFLTEGRLLFDLAPLHPAFVRVFESGVFATSSGRAYPYLAMEWLEGLTLAEEIARRHHNRSSFALEEVLTLLEPIAHALAVAHSRRIAHRDIKPANIFLSVRDDRITPKLLDFGLAKAVSACAIESDVFRDSGLGSCPFTPGYAAPEQWLWQLGATGPWTDVHALALLCSEMLCGVHPFGGSAPNELMAECTDREARPTPGRLGARVDDSVEAVFAKALALDPRARFPEVGAFWLALTSAAGRSDGLPSAPITLEPHSPSESVPVSDITWSSTTKAFEELTGRNSEPVLARRPRPKLTSWSSERRVVLLAILLSGVIGAFSSGRKPTASISTSPAPIVAARRSAVVTFAVNDAKRAADTVLRPAAGSVLGGSGAASSPSGIPSHREAKSALRNARVILPLPVAAVAQAPSSHTEPQPAPVQEAPRASASAEQSVRFRTLMAADALVRRK